ncbi:Selenocysteine lyase [Strongyloides ratti]|uniref:Selenocysteine lyase n=1 Tax=Strongyloides ratti TaxID=34506 RepID=A0A090LDI7_STRRB|nr:Selenocysteine lyase [Strongyloides ratti]CEF65585.1 Selenocysteine lyase [Strongyloides ratti]
MSLSKIYLDKPIYLDYNATTPLSDGVKTSIIESLEIWGNASSSHFYGITPKEVIKKSRNNVANMIGTTIDKVYFTSSGTEANMWIIWNSICNEKINIVASIIEHPSIKLPLEYFENKNFIEVRWVKMKEGIIDIVDLENKIDEKTALVTIMLANNETGVIQPINEVVKIVRKKEKIYGNQIVIHTDAAQIIGKCKINIKELGVDCMTIVGHKFYGPKIGALVICPLSKMILKPMFLGGGQEMGLRSGTENIPMIVGFGKGCLEVIETIDYTHEHLLKLQKYFENKMCNIFKNNISINFSSYDRIPNTSNVCFETLKVPSTELLKLCTKFVASVGAACHSDNTDSCIMMACGKSEWQAKRCIRFSFGKQTTFNELDIAIQDIQENIPDLV